MSDALSSLGAYEEFTLEERIYFTNEDHDGELYKANASLEPWQEQLINNIMGHANSSRSNVMSTLFEMGLENIRDYIGWNNVKEVSILNSLVQEVAINDISSDHQAGVMSRVLNEEKIDFNPRTQPSSNLVNYSFVVKDSVLSEVDRDYVNTIGISKNTAHRVIIGCGPYQCDDVPAGSRRRAEDYIEAFYDPIEKKRSILEEELLRYLKSRHYEWQNNGIPSSVYSNIFGLEEYIEDDKIKEEYLDVLDSIKGIEKLEV